MNSHTTEEFWAFFDDLPLGMQKKAYKAYRAWRRDPFSSGLNFKEVNKKRHLWSARITRDYRVIGVRNGADITWVWIGTHDEYDKRI